MPLDRQNISCFRLARARVWHLLAVVFPFGWLRSGLYTVIPVPSRPNLPTPRPTRVEDVHPTTTTHLYHRAAALYLAITPSRRYTGRMTRQGQADASSTWAPTINPGVSGNDGIGSDERRDSSDISAPSGSADPLRLNGHSGQAVTSGISGDAHASPFHLTPKTEGGAENGSSSSSRPVVNNAVAPPNGLPSSAVKVEAAAANEAGLPSSQSATHHPEAGPGPSSMANAVKREYAAPPTNPLKRRKLAAANYSEVELATYYAREAQ